MHITCFTVGAFQVNTYLLKDEQTGVYALVDTGESTEVIQHLSSLQPEVDLQLILLTHGHIDHAGALKDIQQQYPNAQTCMPLLEKPLYEILPVQGNWFGMPEMNRPCGRIDRWLQDGDQVSFGNTELNFISTPGHTPGQGCYYNAESIFVGDTLFAGSVGRTDLPMGDHALMQHSLKKLSNLPEHLSVYSGHGPVTTLEQELLTNPFLAFLRDGV
jgi:glyoxylase-like metal-dependent hydrolase (beta-lactamase superfamily II)